MEQGSLDLVERSKSGHPLHVHLVRLIVEHLLLMTVEKSSFTGGLRTNTVQSVATNGERHTDCEMHTAHGRTSKSVFFRRM